jgi:hypothetical protein
VGVALGEGARERRANEDLHGRRVVACSDKHVSIMDQLDQDCNRSDWSPRFSTIGLVAPFLWAGFDAINVIDGSAPHSI